MANDNGMTQSSKDSANTPWTTLWSTWADVTTMHGLRYVVAPSRWRLRILLWIIIFTAAVGLLAFLVSQKIVKLVSKETKIDYNIAYSNELRFPAVTMCNQNLFRSTQLHQYGVYDLLVNRQKLSLTNWTGNYAIYTDICSIPRFFMVASSTHFVGNTTRAVCSRLCATVYDLECSGFLFNRRNNSCILSPYTGYWTAQSDEVQKCNRSTTHMEFYRRIRKAQKANILCTFEELKCPLLFDNSTEETWRLVSGEGISSDCTLNLPSGHYLNMALTMTRPGYTARVLTDYVETTGKCIELYFKTSSPSTADVSTISVKAISEDKYEVLLVSSRMVASSSTWYRLYAVLPNGTYQIAIDGRRSRTGFSSLSIDDIAIQSCSKFDAEKQCKTNKAGNGYRGLTTVTSSGNTCVNWTLMIDDNAALLASASLADSNIRNSFNYCRRLSESKWDTVTCFTEQLVEEKCNVHFCECRQPDTYFRCRNGMCVPTNLLCNGIDECGDSSDEESASCTSLRLIPCNFDHPYQCGYTSDTLGRSTAWKRINSPGPNLDTSPVGDATGSTIGYYMLLDSSESQLGDQVMLLSPQRNFTQPTNLSFYFHLRLNSIDTTAALTVYTYSQQHVLDRRLFMASGVNSGSWVKANVCLPVGIYQVAFVGTLGWSYLSDIGLDDITFETTDRPCVNILSNDGDGQVNCSFSGDLCKYIVMNTTTKFSYSFNFVGIEGDPDNGTTAYYNSKSGTILSPNFPLHYDVDEDRKYIIRAPTVAKITLTVIRFSLESEKICGFDWLQITSDSNNRSSKYCGKRIPPLITFIAQVVTLTFHSDDAINSAGFRIDYDIVSLNETDTSVLISLPSSGVLNEHRWTISSPPFTSTTPSCLSIVFTALTYFGVHLRCVAPNGTFSDRLLYRTYGLIDPSTNTFPNINSREAFTTLYLNVNGTSPAVCSLTFEVLSSHYGILAVINQVRMLQGRCQLSNEALPDGYSCSFNDDTCGLVDISTGPSVWTRTLSKDSNTVDLQYSLRCELDLSSNVCLLRSSVFNLTDSYWYCITFNSVPDTVVLNVSAVSDDGRVLSSGRYYDDQQTLCVDLPVNISFSLRIRATSYVTSPVSVQVVDIRNVESKFTVDDGEYHGDDGVKSVSCNFQSGLCSYLIGTCWSYRPPGLSFSSCKDNDLPSDRLITSPIDTFAAGDAITFSIQTYSSSSSPFRIDVYTSVIGHVNVQLGSFNIDKFNIDESTSVHPFNVCLPNGTYSIAFVVVQSSSGDYSNIELNYVNITRQANDCYPSNDTDNNAFSVGQLSSWSMDYIWSIPTITDWVHVDSRTLAGQDSSAYSSDFSQQWCYSDWLYIGEWRSTVRVWTDNMLCFNLNVYSPDTYAINIKLFSGVGNNSTSTKSKTIFKITDISDVNLNFQTVLSFDGHQAATQEYQLVVQLSADVVLNNASFFKTASCLPSNRSSEATYGVGEIVCEFDDFDYCGYSDKSQADSKWIIVSRNATSYNMALTGAERFSSNCLHTADGADYNGTINVDKDGKFCQAWSSQTPNAHPYTDVSFFSANITDLTEIANYCRTLANDDSSEGPVCIPSIFGCYLTKCRIPDCKVFFLQVLFGPSTDVAEMESPVYSFRQSVCLNFFYQISTSTIQLDVYYTSTPALNYSLVGSLTIDSQLNTGVWNRASFLLNNGVARIKFVATNFGISCEPFVKIDRISLTNQTTGCVVAETESVSNNTPVMFPYAGQKLPMSNFSDLVLSAPDKQNFTVNNLYQLLGHQRSQFILFCQWNGRPCNTNDINEEMTSLGLCYTFNGNRTNPYNATSTGPNSGLRLMFNLEQYENIVNSPYDSGVKIHLHSQDELALVDDLGFAIGPGQHGLVTVTKSQVDSLSKDDGGTCGTSPLQYYPVGEVYTASKCRRECQVTSLLNGCKCVNADMPNKSDQLKSCSLNQYVNCVNQNISGNAACDCINQCSVVNYLPGLSNSQLDNFDGFNTDVRIVEWFNTGTETRSRVDNVAIFDIISFTNKVIEANKRFIKDINSLTILPATSVITQVASSLNDVLATISTNISDSRNFLQGFIDGYSNEIEYLVQGISQPALLAASQLAKVQLVLLSTDKLPSSIDIENMILLKDQLEYLRSNLAATTSDRFDSSGSPDLASLNNINRLTGNETIDSRLTTVSTLLNFIIQRCNETGESGSIEWLIGDEDQESSFRTVDVKEDFKRASVILYQSLQNISRDVLQYSGQLNDLVTWLNTASASLNNVSISQSVRPSVALVNAFNGNATYLVAQYESYLAANIATVDFARSIASQAFYTNIQTSVTSIIDELNKSVWTPLTSLVDTKKTLLVDIHYALLVNFASLQQFLNTSDRDHSTSFLRRLSLWRKPSVSRQNQKLTYSLTANQTSTVWSRDTSLNAFVGGVGRSVIGLLVGEICDDIRSYITDAQATIIADLTALSSSTTQLIANLNSYIQKVDASLQRDNFIKVDIYYGELKSETITQSLAYDIASFFGDLGGFYGLCLGGSAITLFEILDLIIYNTLLKLTKKRNKRSVDVESSTRPQTNMDSVSTNEYSTGTGTGSQKKRDSRKLSKRWRPSYAASNINDFAM